MAVGGGMFEKAVAQLRYIKTECEQIPEIKRIIDARDGVYERYQRTFSYDAIPRLTEEEFRDFLAFDNNKHWTNLHRSGRLICQNMDGLQLALRTLHDDSQPIEDRWDRAREAANHFGRATLSAVLHILKPREYGVWNGISEASLNQLGIWPISRRGASEGERYREINDILITLSRHLSVDLWELDALMWGLKECRETIQSLPKRERTLEYILRNSREAVWLKKKYGHKCQICGSVPFDGVLGADISEAHHICWLSRDGKDCRDNMMLLCPNHHTAIHMSAPNFNWTTLQFEFASNAVIGLKLNDHLKAQT
jgi:hypothetical protein